MENYYEILGISRFASQSDIKKAYRNLAKKFHPDSNPNNKKAESNFIKINEAYSILSNEEKREEYDKKNFEKGDSGFNMDIETPKGRDDIKAGVTAEDFARTGDIFKDFFSFDPKTNEHTLNRKNEEIRPMKTQDAFNAIFGRKRF